MVFPVVLYGCESWTIKQAEHWRIDAFELWCWRRLLRVPWTSRRLNQSILKEISPKYSLGRLMLKLKLQYFGTWCEELTHLKRPLMLGDWRQEEKGTTEDEMVGWHRWLSGHEFEEAPGVVGNLACCSAWGCRVGHDWATEVNWTCFPGDSVVKNPPANEGDSRDSGSIPGSGRSPGGGNGSPLQYSCLENPMDRGASWASVRRVATSWTWLKQLRMHAHP